MKGITTTKVQLATCQKCGYRWQPRKPIAEVRCCPKGCYGDWRKPFTYTHYKGIVHEGARLEGKLKRPPRKEGA